MSRLKQNENLLIHNCKFINFYKNHEGKCKIEYGSEGVKEVKFICSYLFKKSYFNICES